jgi:2-methylcitrate dehydratase
MKKVTASPNDAFSRRVGPEMPTSIKIELDNGETIQGEKSVFDGFHSTPMSWDQVQAKFLDKALGREISAIASEIDTVPVKQLTALLARVSAP